MNINTQMRYGAYSEYSFRTTKTGKGDTGFEESMKPDNNIQYKSLGIGFLNVGDTGYGMRATQIINPDSEDTIVRVSIALGGNEFRDYDVNLSEIDPSNASAVEMFAYCQYADSTSEGSYKWGITTSQSYFPKDNTKDFDSDDAIVDWLTQYSDNKDATYVRQFLGRMLFPGDAGVKKVRVLSGGEKVRVMLSKLMISGANVLIVDEPTDHLDMESITALNNGLIKFPGVLLFSSRDHQVVQTTANRIMEIVNGKLIDKITTYDEYLENDEMARKRAVYTTDGMDADN